MFSYRCHAKSSKDLEKLKERLGKYVRNWDVEDIALSVEARNGVTAVFESSLYIEEIKVFLKEIKVKMFIETTGTFDG